MKMKKTLNWITRNLKPWFTHFTLENVLSIPELQDNLQGNFHNTIIKILRSDNGGEYLNREFDACITNHGIQWQLTVTEQNGAVGNFYQSIMDATICLLVESRITIAIWADVVDTACQHHNKCIGAADDY